MAHLLHIDASVQGDDSTSRTLTRLAAQRWRHTHPDGTVTRRDFGADPLPHLTSATGRARLVPPSQHTAEQAASYALTRELVDEIRRADTVLLGLPLYNYGPPSSVKAWADHVVAAGLSFDPEAHTGLLAGRELVVLASRGGGYGPGTPREGWDHAQPWIEHVAAQVGLTPRFITAELTMARDDPAMGELHQLGQQSFTRALADIEGLWAPDASAA